MIFVLTMASDRADSQARVIEVVDLDALVALMRAQGKPLILSEEIDRDRQKTGRVTIMVYDDYIE